MANFSRRDLLKAVPLLGFAPVILASQAKAALFKGGKGLVSPFRFSTLAASGENKVFGGNILQVTSPPGTNTSYQYAWLFQNFSTYYPEWILPQIKNWKARGANEIRMIGGVDGIMLGTYTQSYYEACITQMLSDIRSLGLTMGLSAMAVDGMSTVGTFTAAQWFAPTASLLNNVLNKNLDIMAYIEAGNQESDLFSGENVLSNALAALAKQSTGIPVLISGTLGSFSGFTSANVDLFGLHAYPQNGHGGISWDAMRSYFYNALATTGGKPILMEEFGVSGTNIYQNKADFFNVLSETCFGHPDCVGVSPWGGQGPSVDGDWTYYNPPALPLDPSSVWTDTVVSTAYQNWGPTNRDLNYTISLNGSQAVTTSSVDVQYNIASLSVATPSVTNVNMSLNSWKAFTASFVGTFNFTGDAGTQYTVEFGRINTSDSSFVAIGSPVVFTGSASGQALNVSTSTGAAGNWKFVFRCQATGGANVSGTITAISGSMKLGVF